METGVKLSTDQCPSTDEEHEEMKKYPYTSLIGCLNYLATRTRPDIAFAVSSLSRFNSNPGLAHWNAAKRVLRYLSGSRHFGLVFKQSDSVPCLNVYSDASWCDDVDDGRSTGAYITYYGDNILSWSSTKQGAVSLSSMEAEFYAMAAAVQEAIWLNCLLDDMDMCVEKTILFEDNQSTIQFLKDSKFHSKVKHIARRYFFARDYVKQPNVQLTHCPSSIMRADLLTKPLAADHFEKLVSSLSLC